MGKYDDLLFASLLIPKPDVASALRALAAVPERSWIWDEYRTTWMLPLMTATGGGDRENLRRLRGGSTGHRDFFWTDYAPSAIVEYFESDIFSWLNPRPRIVVLRTPAGKANEEHIDCVRAQYGSRQTKFRIVLQGRVDTLYFITPQGRVYAPSTDRPFLMDGSWPHGMHNDTHQDKITICVGAPWTGADVYPPFETFISQRDFERPKEVDRYFPVEPS